MNACKMFIYRQYNVRNRKIGKTTQNTNHSYFSFFGICKNMLTIFFLYYNIIGNDNSINIINFLRTYKRY